MKKPNAFSTILRNARKSSVTISPLELEYILLHENTNGFAVIESTDGDTLPEEVKFAGVYSSVGDADAAAQRDDSPLEVVRVDSGLIDLDSYVLMHEGTVTQCRRDIILENFPEINSIAWAVDHPSSELVGSFDPTLHTDLNKGDCTFVINDLDPRRFSYRLVKPKLDIICMQIKEARAHVKKNLDAIAKIRENRIRSEAIAEQRRAAAEKNVSPASVKIAPNTTKYKTLQEVYGKPLMSGMPVILQLKGVKTPVIGVIKSATVDEITLCNQHGHTEIVQVSSVAMIMMSSICETIYASGGMGKAL